MGSKSNYLENKMLDHVLGGSDYTRPATVYMALFTAAPDDTGGGTEVSTSGGSLYARKAITNNGTNFPSASGGSKSNGTDIVFATTGAPWGTVTHFGLFDASTSGNLLYWGALGESKTLGTGDVLTIPAGSLTITED